MSGAEVKPLIHDLAAGHQAAFAALYDRFAAQLFRVALAMLGSQPDAEDAVQEVFVNLVKARHRLATIENLRAYLFASLRHTAIKLSTTRNRNAAHDDADLHLVPTPPTEATCDGNSLELEQALCQLPAQQREVVALKLDGALTFAEIGALLGISPNTAAGRYRYALEKLKGALTETTDEPTR
jgi:RNA polymerase sigma-70 factor (ECF subfamily)